MTVFDQLTDALSGSSWAYALIFAVVAGDAVLPLLPGETIVVTGGVLATSGDLNPPLVFLAAAAGAFVGDSACYWIGRKLGTRAAERFLRGERGKRTLDWAAERAGPARADADRGGPVRPRRADRGRADRRHHRVPAGGRTRWPTSSGSRSGARTTSGWA